MWTAQQICIAAVDTHMWRIKRPVVHHINLRSTLGAAEQLNPPNAQQGQSRHQRNLWSNGQQSTPHVQVHKLVTTQTTL